MSIHNLKIYNTFSRKKEKIKPIKGKNRLNLFVCGPTVYDFPHIGHARTYIFFDSFVKYLKEIGFNVFYLQNITDLDDKIIARAREKHVLPKCLAEAFEKEYLKAMKKLHINSVTKYARATSYIKEIINQTERLLEKGYAYKLEDGIYYDISKFKNYGKLSGRTALAAEDAVSRIDYSRDKRNRGDFCLWKFKQEETEPSWNSPFGSPPTNFDVNAKSKGKNNLKLVGGKGRPGWHIEDTAIAEKFFGTQYDIHGGARDLIFPHHEAEISQMEAISDKKPFVRYWMHTGFLTVNGQKMSKSIGNFITIDDFLKRNSYQQLRFLILKNQWHSPLDYSESIMIEVRTSLEKIEEFLRKISNVKITKTTNKAISQKLKKTGKDFYKELDNDFNTPRAFAVIFDFIKEANRFLENNLVSKKQAIDIYNFFQKVNKIFEIIDFKKTKKIVIPSEIKKLMKDREKERNKQNWQRADGIRTEIEKMGYLVEDTKTGQAIKQKN